MNKKRAEAVSKPSKRPRTKKSDVVVGAQEIGDKIDVIEESFRPKWKSTSASGEWEASKGKKPEWKLMLTAAIL